MTSVKQLNNNDVNRKSEIVHSWVTNLHEIHVIEGQTSFFKSFCDGWDGTCDDKKKKK